MFVFIIFKDFYCFIRSDVNETADIVNNHRYFFSVDHTLNGFLRKVESPGPMEKIYLQDERKRVAEEYTSQK